MTPEQQKAYYAKNKAEAAKKEKAKDDEMLKPIREAGAAAVKGMEEGKMNPAGDTYKAGGSVKSASARADGIAIRGKTRA